MFARVCRGEQERRCSKKRCAALQRATQSRGLRDKFFYHSALTKGSKWKSMYGVADVNIVNLANRLDHGRDPGKLRPKEYFLNHQANQHIPPNSGSMAAAKASVPSLWVTFISRQLSDVLGTIGGIFGRQLKNAETAHPVLMCFSRLAGIWHCCFFEDARKTRRLPRRLTFRDSAKLWKAAEHGNADLNSSESRQSFESDIRLGRGSIWLQLSDEQIATLSQ